MRAAPLRAVALALAGLVVAAGPAGAATNEEWRGTVLLLDLVPGRVVDEAFLATYERAATCDTSRAGLAALRTTLAGERAIPAGGRAVLDDAIGALLRTPGAPAGCS